MYVLPGKVQPTLANMKYLPPVCATKTTDQNAMALRAMHQVGQEHRAVLDRSGCHRKASFRALEHKKHLQELLK